MNNSLSKKEFFLPTTLLELGRALGSHPDAFLIGEGLSPLVQKYADFRQASVIIAITRVATLKRMSLNKNYIELGSAVTLNDCLQEQEAYLLPVLKQGFYALGPDNIRNILTVRDVLCAQTRCLDCVVPLCALGAEIELRTFYPSGKKKTQRWLTLKDFFQSDGSIDLQHGEILTRLRIPCEEWNLQVYRKVGSIAQPSLIVVILAKVNNCIINDFCLCIGDGENTVLSDTRLNNKLINCAIPMHPTQRDRFNKFLDSFCQTLPKTFDDLACYALRQILMEALSGAYNEHSFLAEEIRRRG